MDHVYVLFLGRLVCATASAAPAFLLHDVALAGGVAVEGGAAVGDHALGRVGLGTAPALQAHGRRQGRPHAPARHRHRHML
jgi:hypothetical protein